MTVANLHELIATVITDNPEAQPTELAQYAAAATPSEKVTEFYSQALIGEVRKQISGTANTAMKLAIKTPPPPPDSPKLAEYRSFWARFRESRLPVPGGLKRAGSCTVDDLMYCKRQREIHIQRVQASIALFDRLIDLMIEHRAATVDDLPELELA